MKWIILTMVIIMFISARWTKHQETFQFIALVGTIVVIFGSLIWGLSYSMSIREYHEFQAIKFTVEQSRRGGLSELERVSLTKEIMEANKDLAGMKWRNSGIFEDMTYDKYAEEDFIK